MTSRRKAGLLRDVAAGVNVIAAGREAGLRSIRERDLSNAVKLALASDYPNARAKVLYLEDWPSLGRSPTDVVMFDEVGQLAGVLELKWCQQNRDKIYEAVWDAFKLALLMRQYRVPAYLVTGAPEQSWKGAIGGELFEAHTHTVKDLCALRFKSGRSVWDWLVDGGYGRAPDGLPSRISTEPVARRRVEDSTGVWELRMAAVKPAASARMAPMP